MQITCENLICKNDECDELDCKCELTECGYEFIIDITDFNVESDKSGNHTTQYLYTGTTICPECRYEKEVSLLRDELDDTGEILSEELT
jgi:hypothetical protein